MYGVLDRVEDHELAVILMEETKQEIVIPIAKLPPNSKEGTWFQLEEVDGTFRVLRIDKEKTKQKKERSTDLLAQLRARSKGSSYKKNHE